MSRSRPDRGDQARAAAHASRAWVHRRRFGWPGTEPPEGRNPIRRWGSISLSFAAVLVVAVGQTEVAALMLAVGLVLGTPRGWTVANDRTSSVLWALSVVLLVVGEIVWLAGGAAARVSLDSKSAGAGTVLIGLALVPAILGFFRRWGTSGNVVYQSRQARRGDPAALAATRERAQREGWKFGDDD